MDYSKIEEQINDFAGAKKYSQTPEARELGLKQIEMLMELEKIKQLDGIKTAIVGIADYIGLKIKYQL